MERAFSFMDVEALFMAISPAEWFNKRLAPSRHHAVLGSFNTLKPAGKVSLFLLTLFYIIGIGNHFFFLKELFISSSSWLAWDPFQPSSNVTSTLGELSNQTN